MTNSDSSTDPLQRLLPRAAFVVHLATAIDADSGTATGRIEHVLSGRAARFVSIGQLLAFMQHTLVEQGLVPDEPRKEQP